MSAQEVKLGNIAEFIRGINFKPDDVVPLGTEGSVGCMRTKNVQDELDCSDVWAVPKKFVRREEQMLAEGDILVSSANSWNLVGKCSWIPKLEQPSSFGGFVSVLRAKPAKVEPRFLYHWFSWERTQALLRSFGQKTTNISNLNIERCLNLELNLPPFTEQRRIAAILDQADALRAKRREALAQLDSLTQAIFIEMFGDPTSNSKEWHYHPLGELTEKITDGEHLNPEFSSTGIPIVMAGNVLEDSIDLAGAKNVAVAFGEKFRRKCNPERGDLLMVSRGATIGRMCAVNTDEIFCLMGSVILIKVNKNKLHTAFVSALLKHPVMRSALYKTSGSSAQQAIYIKDLKNLPFIQPPLQLQQQFSERVRKIGELRIPHRQSLRELDTLFASLQYSAFRGEL